jgi:hypothetical protein
VVREDRVAEADAGGGGEQCRCQGHAELRYEHLFNERSLMLATDRQF